MSITMQGSWTVRVKAKNAAFPQRFRITGASSGNGVYAGETSTPPVFVTGGSWSITVENNPGTGFITSDDRIRFPTTSLGQYRFDIETNDAGGDEDFDDLVLTCSTPVTETDFIVYGNVTAYSGRCIFNPCWPRLIVIDSAYHLFEALRYPVLRRSIEELYPERAVPVPPRPGPQPDPPFTPLVIPLQGETALPPKRAEIMRLAAAPREETSKRGAARAEEEGPESGRMNVVSSRTVEISKASALSTVYDRVALNQLAAQFYRVCSTEPLAGFILRFLEYDRTAAELAGGTYTGTGTREELGTCATDRNGNYIFRFSRSIGQFIDESDTDVATGEDEIAQSMPDLIAQLVDTTVPGTVAYESAPYWNVPRLKRINLCVPADRIPRPSGCQGDNLIQKIGKIRLGIPATTFDSEGRVTCTDTSLPGVPQTQCAAWSGALYFFGCFSAEKGGPVKQYTVRYRHRVGLGWSGWSFYQEPMGLWKIAIGDTAPVGPFDRSLEVVDGAPFTMAKAYDNIEHNAEWAASDWFLKAVVSTGGGSPAYAPTPGTVQFRVQGYDAAGNQVPGANDTVTLYIDNTAPELDIPLNGVTMGAQTGGVCALFDISEEQPTPVPTPPIVPPLKVRFKALQRQGFMSSYTLSVRKGNLSSYTVVPTTGPGGETSGALSRSYSHNTATNCNDFFGTATIDEPQADGSNYVEAYVVPAGGANWLDPGQTFCTFAVSVGCSTRVTDGNSTGWGYGPIQYLLGIQA